MWFIDRVADCESCVHISHSPERSRWSRRRTLIAHDGKVVDIDVDVFWHVLVRICCRQPKWPAAEFCSDPRRRSSLERNVSGNGAWHEGIGE